MTRQRLSDEDVVKLLREIELKLTAGDDVASACRYLRAFGFAKGNLPSSLAHPSTLLAPKWWFHPVKTPRLHLPLLSQRLGIACFLRSLPGISKWTASFATSRPHV